MKTKSKLNIFSDSRILYIWQHFRVGKLGTQKIRGNSLGSMPRMVTTLRCLCHIACGQCVLCHQKLPLKLVCRPRAHAHTAFVRSSDITIVKSLAPPCERVCNEDASQGHSIETDVAPLDQHAAFLCRLCVPMHGNCSKPGTAVEPTDKCQFSLASLNRAPLLGDNRR